MEPTRTTTSIFQAYGFEPPGYHDCNCTTEESLKTGAMARANRDATNNDWKLTSIDDDDNTDISDPLVGLSRMGILDLINHDKTKNVTIVIPVAKKSCTKSIVDQFQKLLPNNTRYLEMKRGKTPLFIYTGIKILPLEQDLAQNPEGELQLYLNEGSHDSGVSLKKIRDGGIIEIWKLLNDKVKDVSDFLKLLKKQKDIQKKVRMMSFLIKESHNDRLLTMSILKELYQQFTSDSERKRSNLEAAHENIKKKYSKMKTKKS